MLESLFMVSKLYFDNSHTYSDEYAASSTYRTSEERDLRRIESPVQRNSLPRLDLFRGCEHNIWRKSVQKTEFVVLAISVILSIIRGVLHSMNSQAPSGEEWIILVQGEVVKGRYCLTCSHDR